MSEKNTDKRTNKQTIKQTNKQTNDHMDGLTNEQMKLQTKENINV